jgi:hypothetical protein
LQERYPLAHPDDVREALALGVADALERHKRLGQSVYTWRDGRVVEVPANQIVAPRPRRRRKRAK